MRLTLPHAGPEYELTLYRGSSHSETQSAVKCDCLAGGGSQHQNKGHLETADFLETSRLLLQDIIWTQVQTSHVPVPIRTGERLVAALFQLLHFITLMRFFCFFFSFFRLFVLEITLNHSRLSFHSLAVAGDEESVIRQPHWCVAWRRLCDSAESARWIWRSVEWLECGRLRSQLDRWVQARARARHI